jgi:hypothetical protein
MTKRIAMFTEIISDDADAARLAERVEECMADNRDSIVLWYQSPLWFGRVRMTGVVTWYDSERGVMQ